MKRRAVLMGLGLLAVPSLTRAHSKMSTSTPSDGALLDAPPATFSLHFQNEVRLVSLVQSHTNGRVEFPGLAGNGLVAEQTLPLTDFGPGAYTIEWRGLAGDGHVMTGTFTFSVQ